MQGWRKTHEDAHIFECSCGGPEPSGVFVVLDGHGGKVAADHSRDILKELLVPLMQRGSLDKTTAEEELRRIFINR
jgi:serine/threonine protein phosphatase PrpC